MSTPTHEIKRRAMSADTSASAADLQLEAVELFEIESAHRQLIDRLWDVQTDAELAGDRELAALVRRQIEAVEDDDRAYWATARLRDIRMRLGAGYNPQLRLPMYC